MTDKEIEFVARELAESSGVKWPEASNPSPIQKAVADRFRDRARAAIAAVDRFRARSAQIMNDNSGDDHRTTADGVAIMSRQDIRPGATLVYRPPGDRRALRCRIEKVDGSQAFLVPLESSHTYLVRIEDLEVLRRP